MFHKLDSLFTDTVNCKLNYILYCRVGLTWFLKRGFTEKPTCITSLQMKQNGHAGL